MRNTHSCMTCSVNMQSCMNDIAATGNDWCSSSAQLHTYSITRAVFGAILPCKPLLAILTQSA